MSEQVIQKFQVKIQKESLLDGCFLDFAGSSCKVFQERFLTHSYVDRSGYESV
jgi:hypothetical protein